MQIPAAPAPSTHTYAIDLTVGRVAGSDLLASAPIVYKSGTNQVGTYAYHRWTDAPLEMVQEKLIRLLRKSGELPVGESASTPATGGRRLMLRGRLYDFAEVDGERNQRAGHHGVRVVQPEDRQGPVDAFLLPNGAGGGESRFRRWCRPWTATWTADSTRWSRD